MEDERPVNAAKRRLEGDAGANLVEYALLISLIFLVALGAVQVFGKNATSKMNCASSSVTNSNNSSC